MRESVILVDVNDRVRGPGEKVCAHRNGALHRAFSVFVFRRSGALLLQRRSNGKYHSAGLWSNTCCGHPRPGEAVADAAKRRLHEEMGLECPLAAAFGFLYRANVGGGLWEHEYDHVFVGLSEGEPIPDPDEVAGWQWVDCEELLIRLEASPEQFTVWFPIALQQLRAWLGERSHEGLGCVSRRWQQ